MNHIVGGVNLGPSKSKKSVAKGLSARISGLRRVECLESTRIDVDGPIRCFVSVPWKGLGWKLQSGSNHVTPRPTKTGNGPVGYGAKCCQMLFLVHGPLEPLGFPKVCIPKADAQTSHAQAGMAPVGGVVLGCLGADRRAWRGEVMMHKSETPRQRS